MGYKHFAKKDTMASAEALDRSRKAILDEEDL
jgi:hypothetical protein